MEIFRELRYEVIERITLLDAYLVRLEDDTLENGRLRALSHSGIHYVEPNRPVRALGAAYPNDPLFADQWHYPLIRLPQAWGVTKGSSEVRIAVIDTGVQDDHEELNPRLDRRYGYNFVDSSRDFDDDEGHGTHVTGTICALTNNGVGVAGVMWDATILPLKVLDSEGNGSVWVLAKAILYAAGLLDDPNFPRNPAPVDVINMSLGTDTSDPLMQEAIERVLSSTQIIMVAAAGNDSEPVMYPAAYPGVIAVGAVDYNEYGTPSIASYSNWGPEIDVVAPGGDSYAILSTSAGPAPYEKLTGTSMATPHVSGVVGLMLSHGVPANRVLEVLRLTSMPLRQSRFDFYSGYGLVNAYWAVNAVSTMRIIVGTRHGDLVDVVAETSILDPQGGDFVLAAVPPGDYHVFAWVDVQDGTDRIELGDYFAETGVIRIDSGHEYHVTGVITEVGPGEHDLDSPQRPQLESSSL
jgi:serine protease